MANENADKDSGFVNLARGLVGGGKKADELEDMVDGLVPNADGETIDGVVGSTILGVANSNIRERLAAEATEREQPLIHARERELQDGRIAVHMFVSDPSVQVYRGDESVLLKTSEWETEQILGFEPGGIEYEQGGGESDTVSEFVVYPKNEPIETDYPPDDDEEAESEEDLDAEAIEDEDAED